MNVERKIKIWRGNFFYLGKVSPYPFKNPLKSKENREALPHTPQAFEKACQYFASQSRLRRAGHLSHYPPKLFICLRRISLILSAKTKFLQMGVEGNHSPRRELEGQRPSKEVT